MGGKRKGKKIIRKIIDLYLSGKSLRFIAIELDMCRSTIRYILIRHNIPRRPKRQTGTYYGHRGSKGVSLSIPKIVNDRLKIVISKKVKDRLNEIAIIENLPTHIIIEKLIMGYTPIPSPNIPGEFKPMCVRKISTLKRIKPYVIVVSVYPNIKFNIQHELYDELKKGLITQQEFTRKYIERLMLPDAQEEIIRLRKLRESNDVYITSFEAEEDGLIRNIIIDYLNGKLIWK